MPLANQVVRGLTPPSAEWNFVLSPENGSQDPSGAYCRRWLPELSRLPNKWLHTPWLAPTEVLVKAGVELGGTYPERILVDLPAARRETVGALLEMRAASLEKNDPGGYDLITLPTTGEVTRVFTKQEYRLTASGQPKPPPAFQGIGGRARGAGSAGGARGGGRSGKGGRGRGAGGTAPPAGRGGGGSDPQQKSITSYLS